MDIPPEQFAGLIPLSKAPRAAGFLAQGLWVGIPGSPGPTQEKKGLRVWGFGRRGFGVLGLWGFGVLGFWGFVVLGLLGV